MDDDAPTTPPAPEQPAETPAPQPQQPETDWKAEAEKWKSHARKHEQLWKEKQGAVKELEELKTSQLSDTERAVKEAEARGRAEATMAYSQQIAAAELKAALTGVVADPNAVIEDINLAKYVTDKGDVNTEAIAAARDKFAALFASPPQPQAPTLHQGRQGQPSPGQLTRADLSNMSPDDINKAIAEGRLDEVRGIKTY